MKLASGRRWLARRIHSRLAYLEPERPHDIRDDLA
jgi:hypothetical protein